MMWEAAQALHQQWPWFWPLWGGVLGAVLGSLIGCAFYRMPRGQSMRTPPSYCPQCRTTLGAPDLIPIFSWLALRGRCRHCNAPIGWQALLMEVFCTAVGAWVVWALLP